MLMFPGISTSRCTITGRLKDARSGAGRENSQSTLTIVTGGTGSPEQLQMTPADFNRIQEEMQTATSITFTRRSACPAHETLEEQEEEKNKIVTFFVTALHMTLMMVFVLFPPWPPRIVRKIMFRSPPRGQSYMLICGEGDKSKTTFFAREAVNKPNVRLCLPPLLTKKVDAIDVFYHLLRSQVTILPVEKDVNICSVYLSCDLTRMHLPEGSKSPYLVIFCQPNSSDLGTCLLMEPNFADIADFLWCDMLFFDYPGYGVSDGQPSEYLVYRSSEIIMAHAKSLGFAEENIILMGFSLGTAAAIHLASICPKVASLVLMAPFTSLLRVFCNRPKIVSSWDMDFFRSIDKASAVACPTLVCHGKKDFIVKLCHGKTIAAEIPGAEMFVVEKASHQSLLCQRSMWDKVQEFLEGHLGIMPKWKRLVRQRTISQISPSP